MYLNNKYTHWYYSIINRATSRTLSKDIYIEKHHIIPRSLGGNNSKNNLVNLTAREHFICHRLLTKMTENKNKRKMMFAINMMLSKTKSQNRYVCSSHTYKKIKEDWSKVNPFNDLEWQKENSKTARVGKLHTTESKNLISQKNKGKAPHNKGVPMSSEMKLRIIQTKKSNPRPAWNKGIKMNYSLEAQSKMIRPKTWKICPPNGKEEEITNLKKFCRENNLSWRAMKDLASNLRTYYLGWSCNYS